MRMCESPIGFVTASYSWATATRRSRRSEQTYAASLAYVRVLEFGHFVAGPFAGTVRSDLGADVEKLEPLTGDALRGENAAPFMSANRGKRAIALDIAADGGLLRGSSKPQPSGPTWSRTTLSRRRHGAGHCRGQRCARASPASSSCNRPPADQTGRRRPSWSSTRSLCFAGHFVRLLGWRRLKPLAYRFNDVDYASGMMGALGVVSALYAGRRGGTVPSVNVSLMNTAVFMLSQLVREPDGQFHGLPTLSEDRTGFSPAESLYRAADGWLAVTALGEPAGRRLAEALDLPRVAELPASQWDEREKQEIGEAISRQTVQAAVGSLRQSGVWAEPVQTEPVLALMSDEGTVAAGARRLSSARRTARCSDRSRAASRQTCRLSNQLTAADAHVPELGEHTREGGPPRLRSGRHRRPSGPGCRQVTETLLPDTTAPGSAGRGLPGRVTRTRLLRASVWACPEPSMRSKLHWRLLPRSGQAQGQHAPRHRPARQPSAEDLEASRAVRRHLGW